MVRLKGTRYTGKVKGFKEFQFHNGSIKRYTAILFFTMFDSFQFHNGSIKRLSDDGSLDTIKRLRGVSLDESSSMFQFHNGSIKRWRGTYEDGDNGFVSIPQWFD